MKIEITPDLHVLVDGVNHGVVADTITNNPKLASVVQTALFDVFVTDQKAAFDKALKDAAAALMQAKVEGAAASKLLGETSKANLDALKSEYAAYRASVEQASKAIKSVITDTKVDDTSTVKAVADIIAFGEVEANKPVLQKQLETLQSEIAAKQKAADELAAKLATE